METYTSPFSYFVFLQWQYFILAFVFYILIWSLSAWKKFFDNGTNWKDFADGISYSDYKAMTDKQHIAKAKSMPVKFLKSSGKGFFIDKEGYVIAIREDLEKVICKEAFKKHMKDILEYRTMEYYRRRYRGE